MRRARRRSGKRRDCAGLDGKSQVAQDHILQGLLEVADDSCHTSPHPAGPCLKQKGGMVDRVTCPNDETYRVGVGRCAMERQLILMPVQQLRSGHRAVDSRPSFV
ncbi:hypothetical protein BaRGS_00014630 [Batillaria attramentaria]|uniref:Uncharacterized protein n=1 Tax=Batillaria attramentaria TaxID=370345 RepID=A0ABD0L522_9CAEN